MIVDILSRREKQNEGALYYGDEDLLEIQRK